jgi:hypothetical protein
MIVTRYTRAFSNWQKHATFPSAGRAGVVCVTVVKAVWFRERWPTDQNRSINPLKAIFWFAAHNQFVMSSSICEARRRWDLPCFPAHSVVPDTRLEAMAVSLTA